ncbi:MAG: hypothetical protein LBG58_02980 [Planctomycetaceae bacterium]|jgi:DNA repair exonuclease SbcCD ATPase subunit|nr:hypothetical protein [Planctomycetaceae bacterium]
MMRDTHEYKTYNRKEITMSTNNNNNISNTTDGTFEKVLLVIEKNAKQWRRKNKRLAKRSAKEFEVLRQNQKQTDEQLKQTTEQLKQTDEQIKQTLKEAQELLKQFIKQSAERSKEIDERFKEMSKEADERRKQTDEQLKLAIEQVKRAGKQIGKLGNRFGSMVEYLVAPGMLKQFNEINYHFSDVIRNYKIHGENKKILAEIDVMLENDDYILCVEVKMTPEVKDIREHIERLKIVQRYFKNRRSNEKRVIGAIAGTIFSDQFKQEVIKNGLYAITPSGHTFKIDVPEGFQPQIFYGE